MLRPDRTAAFERAKKSGPAPARRAAVRDGRPPEKAGTDPAKNLPAAELAQKPPICALYLRFLVYDRGNGFFSRYKNGYRNSRVAFLVFNGKRAVSRDGTAKPFILG
ncbi:hypothetical protein GCM10027018_16180 [Paenibacillus thermoaerophilus]